MVTRSRAQHPAAREGDGVIDRDDHIENALTAHSMGKPVIRPPGFR